MQEILHRTEIALGRIRHCGYAKRMTNILANHLSGRKHVTDSASWRADELSAAAAAARRVEKVGGGARPAQSASPWCGQPLDRGRLKNRTEQCCVNGHTGMHCILGTNREIAYLTDQPIARLQ